jgi:hypothetical protein
LRQVVAQRLVARGLGEEETPDRRLVFTHKLVERPPVVKHSHLCRKSYIVKPSHPSIHQKNFNSSKELQFFNFSILQFFNFSIFQFFLTSRA